MISPARNTNLPKNIFSYSFGNLPQGFGQHDGYKIHNKENVKVFKIKLYRTFSIQVTINGFNIVFMNL